MNQPPSWGAALRRSRSARTLPCRRPRTRPAQTPNPGSLSLPLGADGAAPPTHRSETRHDEPSPAERTSPPRPWLLRLLAFACLCLLPAPAPACRYNVRDVGFVDLETEPYHLYFYLPDSLPPDTRTVIRETAARTLRDANVTVELIDLAGGTPHPALIHRPAPPIGPGAKAELTAVLVSPDPQNPPLPIALPTPVSDPAFAADLGRTLADLVESPLRQRILDHVTQAFGAILLIEGTDSPANQLARTTLGKAIEETRAHMKSLPKPIAEPPAVVTLEAAQLATERVLLWSLRSDTRPTPEPRAVALYGRARWIGPMMRGPEISTRNVGGLFSLVGADCECGLDLAWTQGTRLPVRWEERRHAPLALALGFDPENPVVKTEISSILGRRGSGPAREISGPQPTEATPTPAVPGATVVSPGAKPGLPAPAAPATPKPLPISGPPASAAPPSTSSRAATWLLVVLAGLGTLAAGGWIVWQAGRRRE